MTEETSEFHAPFLSALSNVVELAKDEYIKNYPEKKNSWTDEKLVDLFTRLKHNYNNMSAEIYVGSLEGIIKRAINVINYAIMIAENAERLKHE